MSSALTSTSLPLLPSFRRQQLLLEFASLKHHCPDGIYLTPNPNDPATWSGVYFVREGPYQAALLRFELLFPPSYPETAPLVIFSTEIFHPLLVPLTTYTFSSGSADPFATYSASETERLPPGALSLKHGFPHWFATADRGRSGIRATSVGRDEAATETGSPLKNENNGQADNIPTKQEKEDTTTVQLLKYVKAAFEDFDFLDELPIEAAGNSNAWHAWRSHRGLPKQKGRPASPTTMNSARSGASPRNPADWNWDGVWEARVRSGVAESVSEALLFGSKNNRGGPSISDPIRFTRMDDDRLASIQDDMLRMHGFPLNAPKG